MQHEGEALGGGQGVEHDQQRQPDRIGEEGFLLGVRRFGAAGGGDDGGGVERVLAAGRARAEHVEADAGHDGGQPTAEVVEAIGVGAAKAQPGFLDGVVSFGRGAEHAVGHPTQVAAMLLETFRQQVAFGHCHILPSRGVKVVTNAARPM